MTIGVDDEVEDTTALEDSELVVTSEVEVVLSTDKDELLGVEIVLASEEDTIVNNGVDVDSRASVAVDDPLNLTLEADEGTVLPTGVRGCDSTAVEVWESSLEEVTLGFAAETGAEVKETASVACEADEEL